MAIISNVTLLCSNSDFNTGTSIDYLRGNIQDNAVIVIQFDTDADVSEVDFKFSFIDNFTDIYPNGGFEIPLSLFNSPVTGDLQSWKGAVNAFLIPNSVKRWQDATVQVIAVGNDGVTWNWRIDVNTKLSPLLLPSDVNANGQLDSSLSGYAGNKSFKPVFEINTYATVGDITPSATTKTVDLGGGAFSTKAIKYGNIGYLDEYLSGGAPIYHVGGLQETNNSFRALLTRASGSFLTTDKVILKFQRVTNEFNIDLDLDDNLLYFQVDCLADGILTVPSDDRITSITATISGGNLIVDIEYNPLFFYGLKDYAITVTVGTAVFGTPEATHERTTALMVFKDFDYPFSADLFEIRPTSGIERALFFNQVGNNVSNASDNVEGYPEDVQLLNFNFGIKRAVYSIDEATLTSLRLKISDSNGTFQSRSFITSQNFSQTSGLYLPSDDPFNIISLDIVDEENYIDNTALKIINQYTLQRFDSGNFTTDGFTVGDSITITGDITNSSIITVLTTTVMTISNPIDGMFVGNFWTIDINGTAYTNFPAEGIFNYKLYNIAYPFVINPSWPTKTGLKLEIEMAVSQTMPDGTIESDTFVYKVDDFIIYDYDQNNTIDTTMVGSIQLSDSTGAQLTSGIFDDIDTKVVSTFIQTALGAELVESSGYNNINLFAGAEQTNEYFGSSRPNKTGKFGSGLTVLTSPLADNIEVTSTLDHNQLIDIDYRLSSRLHIPIARFIFFTNINPAVDGTFDPSFALGFYPNAEYTFKDQSSIVGVSISTSANGLDGTVQPVVFSADEFSTFGQMNFDNDFITGVLDMSAFNGLTYAGLIRVNTNTITSLTLPIISGALFGEIQFNSSTELVTVDLTPINGSQVFSVQFSSSPKLETVTWGTRTDTINRVYFNTCASLGVGGVDVSGWIGFANVNSHLGLFSSSGLTEAQVDKVLIDYDNNNLGGFTGRSLQLQGNAAPSAAGIVAKNNLITKGFSVTTA